MGASVYSRDEADRMLARYLREFADRVERGEAIDGSIETRRVRAKSVRYLRVKIDLKMKRK